MDTPAMDEGRARPRRATRAPTRLDLGGDDTALQQALRLSLKHHKQELVDTKQIPEAPVFRPTAEEFQDPYAYIQKIRPEAIRCGICKVVPPEGWRPDCVLDQVDQTRRFKTKRQKLHLLQQGRGIDEGARHDQFSYRRYAESFAADFYERHPELLQDVEQLREAGVDEWEARATVHERFYWRVVETQSEEVTVDYANDQDMSKFGSAFSEDDRGSGRPSPWDLRSFPVRDRSVLRKLDQDVEGVTRPWLYYGALFSTFCWHTEDHFLYSINYMHEGAPKTWYGAPHTASRKFEATLKQHLPLVFEVEPDLLYRMSTAISPRVLMDHGVPIVRTLQRPGEFVVTFPDAFHGGFSHGWNCAEAVNFATIDWIPLGRTAITKYKSGRGKRGSVFPHDKMVHDLARLALGWDTSQSGVERSHVYLTGDKGIKQVAGRLVVDRVGEDEVASRGNESHDETVSDSDGGRATHDGARSRAREARAQGQGHGQGHGQAEAEAPSRPLWDIDTLACEHCGRGDREDQMIICDACDRGFHMDCLVPRLETVPEGEWRCMRCEGERGAAGAEAGAAAEGGAEGAQPGLTALGADQAAEVGGKASAETRGVDSDLEEDAGDVVGVLPSFFETEFDWDFLARDLRGMAEDEMHFRRWLRDHKEAGLTEYKVQLTREQEEDLPHCCICQAIPYFAWARCSCRPGKLACLEHAYYGCLCGSESKTMEVFVSDRRLLHLVEVTHRRMLAHRRPVPVRTRRAADGDESECEVDDETRCTKATFNWQCKHERMPGSRYCEFHERSHQRAQATQGPPGQQFAARRRHLMHAQALALGRYNGGAGAGPSSSRVGLGAAGWIGKAKRARPAEILPEEERCTWANMKGSRCRYPREAGSDLCLKHSQEQGTRGEDQCHRSGRSWQCVGAREAGSLYCPVHGREVRAKNRRFAAKRAAKKAADALDDLLKKGAAQPRVDAAIEALAAAKGLVEEAERELRKAAAEAKDKAPRQKTGSASGQRGRKGRRGRGRGGRGRGRGRGAGGAAAMGEGEAEESEGSETGSEDGDAGGMGEKAGDGAGEGAGVDGTGSEGRGSGVGAAGADEDGMAEGDEGAEKAAKRIRVDEAQ